MNFVAAMLILARVPSKYVQGSHSSHSSNSILSDNKTESISNSQHDLYTDIHTVSTLMSEDESLSIEVDVFELMLLIISKHGKLAMCGLWCPHGPKMKLRLVNLFLRPYCSL